MSSLPRPHPVAQRRRALGWSQAELAARAGIPRSSLSAIESRRLVPSVAAALAVARALECSVEELFGAGGLSAGGEADWAWPPPGDPCRFWEAEVGGRRWRYPVESLAASPGKHDGICIGGVPRGGGGTLAARTLMVASCDPAARLLAGEYERSSGFRMIVLPRNGAAALELLRDGRVHVAGVHQSTKDHPFRNAERARGVLGSGFRLIRAAHWMEGIAVAPSKGVRSVLQAARKARTWALREPGSAARECLEEVREGRPAPGRVVLSHAGVAEAVRAGWAEAGVCVKIAAQEAGVRFLPVREEAVDLCIPERYVWDPRVQALLRVLRNREYRRTIGELPGYDARETGERVHQEGARVPSERSPREDPR